MARTTAFLALILSSIITLAQPVVAQEAPLCEELSAPSISSGEDTFFVAKVAGLIDPVVLSYLDEQLTQANDVNAAGFVIWMDSEGSIVSDEDLGEFADDLESSTVPTGLWVGNSVGNRGRGNANALGGAGQLAAHVDQFVLSPGSTWGDFGDPINQAANQLPADLASETISAEESIERGLSQGPLEVVADIKQFLASFDSFETTDCVTDSGAQVRQAVTETQISGLTLSSQLFHTASSPEVALLFFTLGLGLLVFEFFTAGIGIAGLLGAGSLLLGSYGLWNLPTRWWAVAGLILGIIAIAVDIQTNLPRLYTAIGLGIFSVSSIFAFSGMRASWITLGVIIISAFIYAYSAMPAMVRARFSTPTIGRKSMIGKTGLALASVDPDGLVEVEGAKWNAITNRATPIAEGDQIVVAGIDRLTLEVEPTEGAARDYRER